MWTEVGLRDVFVNVMHSYEVPGVLEFIERVERWLPEAEGNR